VNNTRTGENSCADHIVYSFPLAGRKGGGVGEMEGRESPKTNAKEELERN
jgi:hypothetical protein